MSKGKKVKQAKPQKKAIEKVEWKTLDEVPTTIKQAKKEPTKEHVAKHSRKITPPKHTILAEVITPPKKVRTEHTIKSTKKSKKVVEELRQGNETYFVYLRNPLDYRRQLLESSKIILLCLRGYHRILVIRQQKMREMAKLKASVKELKYMSKKFNEKLPRYTAATSDTEPEETKASVNKRPIPQPPIEPTPITEIDRLEQTLAGIEQRLRSLK